MVNIIKQEVVIEESLKKKLKQQLSILMMRWTNMQRDFMIIKERKKKTMVLSFKTIVFFIYNLIYLLVQFDIFLMFLIY